MTISDRITLAPGVQAKSQRRKASAGIILVLGLVAGLIAFAPSASAHHPEISARSVCADGLPVVHYTAVSWAPDEVRGYHPAVTVQYRLTTSGEWTDLQTSSFQPGHDEFSGSQSFPAETTVVYLRAKASSAPWGDWYDADPYSIYSNTGGQIWPDNDGLAIALATGCVPPPEPTASARVACAEQQITVSFTGVGSATTVDISKNGTLVGDDVAVPVGASSYDVALAGGDENTDVTITLDYAAASATDQSLVVPVDCNTPAAPGGSIRWACGSDVTIALTNSGEESIDATIFRNGTAIETLAVPPGGTSTTVSPTAENTTMTIRVEFADAGSSTDLTNEFTVDCDQPAPTIAEPVCQAGGGLDVTLGNTEGSDTATFVIVVDGEETSVDVAAGGSRVVTIPVAEDATIALSIRSGEATYENATLTRNCQRPAATVVFTCAAGGVVVSLTNSGSESATVDVDGELFSVPAGTTADDPVMRTIPVAEGADYDITVLGVNASGTRDCENPAIASVQVECSEGGVVVVLTNDGESDTTVTVDGIEVVVPAGTTEESPVRVTVPVEENEAYDFTVVGDELEQQVTGTLDCLFPEPAVDGELVCAKGGLRAVLHNTGDDTADYTVTSPALPGGEIAMSVAAGDTESVLIPLAESATTSVTVASGDQVLLEETVTRDCEIVLPGIVTTTVPVPTSMPRTGSDSSGLFALAGTLLLAGLVFVAGSRRKAIEVK